MMATMHHRTTAQLEAGLDHVRTAPIDGGTLELIVARPAEGERVVLAEAELSDSVGLVGDTWHLRPSSRTPDKSPHPDMQLNVMSARAVALIAGDRERWPLAGDQLYVDLDLSSASLAPWTKLALGDAVIRITDQPHTGCAKFTERFGLDAHRFVNSEQGRALNLRGVNARVVQPGTIRAGDTIVRL